MEALGIVATAAGFVSLAITLYRLSRAFWKWIRKANEMTEKINANKQSMDNFLKSSEDRDVTA